VDAIGNTNRKVNKIILDQPVTGTGQSLCFVTEVPKKVARANHSLLSTYILHCTRYEGLTAVTMSVLVFRAIMPCGFLARYLQP
jgi:hypothetical protein